MKRLLLAGSTIAAATPLAAQSRTPDGRPIPGARRAITVYDNPEPKGLASKYAVSVQKLADGSCDWGHMVFVPQPKGYAARLGKRDDRTCTGTIYDMLPRDDTTGMKSDTVTIRILHSWHGATTDTIRGRPGPRPDTGDAKVIRVDSKPETPTEVNVISLWSGSRADSLAIRAAARTFMHMAADTSAAFPRIGIRGDTVLVPTWVDPEHIAMTTVRVVRRGNRWVAVSNAGLAIR